MRTSEVTEMSVTPPRIGQKRPIPTDFQFDPIKRFKPIDPPSDEPSFDAKVELVASQFGENRPPPYVKEKHPLSYRWAADVVSRIKSNPKSMKAVHIDILLKTTWFADFFTCCMISLNNPLNLTADEMVDLICRNFPYTEPAPNEFRLSTTSSGKPISFVAEEVLNCLKKNWNATYHAPSSKSKKALRALPWGESWAQGMFADKKRDAAKAAQAVSTSTKVDLFRLFQAKERPTHSRVIPIAVSKELVYEFKPADWLHDIAHNWTNDKRRRVVLTEAQKEAIESLPWFPAWVEQLAKAREKKKAKTDQEDTDSFFAEKITNDAPGVDARKVLLGDSDDEEDQDPENTPESQVC